MHQESNDAILVERDKLLLEGSVIDGQLVNDDDGSIDRLCDWSVQIDGGRDRRLATKRLSGGESDDADGVDTMVNDTIR